MIAIVPAYGDNLWRHRNLGVVVAELNRGGFDACKVKGDSPGQARNRGAALPAFTGLRLLLFNDGDSVCPPEQIRDAVKLAAEAPGLVFAYDTYLRLTRAASERFRAADNPLSELAFPPPASALERDPILSSGSMGCVAISRDCFDLVGGFDENYQGWGYEDLDFARRCGERWPLRRVPGPLYHLWHGARDPATDMPLDADKIDAARNRLRFTRTGTPAAAPVRW
jgi:hypothetical protein